MKIKNKKVVILLLVFLLAGVVGGGYYFIQKNNSQQIPQATPPEDEDKINFDPPTEEDAQRVEENKQQIVNNQEALKNYQPPQPGAKKTVTPIISYAGQYDSNVEVGGYVNGIFEEGGTCTATFTRGALAITKSVTAVTNVNAVDCPAMIVNVNDFQQKGNWGVTVTYSSPNASGTSDKKTLEVK